MKVFRLEPKVRGLEAADKKTESPVKEELTVDFPILSCNHNLCFLYSFHTNID